MKELDDWWQSERNSDRNWLLIGKGPTFSKVNELDLSEWNTIGINHVVRSIHVDACSIIDIDVVDDCATYLDTNAQFVLMPRHPHVKNRPTEATLDSFFSTRPILRKLSDQGRLIVYDLSSTPTSSTKTVVPVGEFSADTLVNLLGVCGAKHIRTIGVDGGTCYSTAFADLSNRTLLANGQRSFDIQFTNICRAIRKYGLDFSPIDTECPVRVFIGTDESQMLGARVLEYSIGANCAVTTICDPMLSVTTPLPKDPANQPRTNFSFNRFAIPSLAGHRGRAVYLDADMLVLRDFRELWDAPFDGATVLYCPPEGNGRQRQLSVMLLDCSRLKWQVDEVVRGLDEGAYDYSKLMGDLCIEPEANVRPSLPYYWNSLERYEPGRTGLIHYTDMATQPWVSARNPNGDLWVQALRCALRDGFINEREVVAAIRKGFCRPSLRWQLAVPRRLWRIFNRTLSRVLDYGFRPHANLRKRLAAVQPTH